MRILICLSILIVATTTCHTLTGVNLDSDSKTENDIVPPEYSRANNEDYRARLTPSSPKFDSTRTYDIHSPKAVRAELNRNSVPFKGAPSLGYKTEPAVRTVIEEDGPVAYKTQSYSVPKSPSRAYSPHAVRTFDENEDLGAYNNDYIDQEVRPGVYQPEEYPAVPIGPPYAPPIRVYSSLPTVVRREYRVPVYRRPRVFNVGSPAYRALEYGIPAAYSIPSVRNVAYGYQSPYNRVRIPYASSNIAFDHGIAPVQVSGFIEGEYDELLKKK